MKSKLPHARGLPRSLGRASAAAKAASTEADAPSETQQKILAAALELFAARGYAATSTAAIAQRAGVAEKTLFANFASKERLFDRVLTPAAIAVLLPEAIRGVADTLATSWPSLRALVDALMHDRLAFARANSSRLRLVAQALLLHPEIAALFVRVFREHLAARADAVVDGLEAAGKIRRMPRASLLRIVASVTGGYMLTRFVFRPNAEWDDEAEIATMIDVLVDGLRPRRRAREGAESE